jgi:AcrR family transcriptional regulator
VPTTPRGQRTRQLIIERTSAVFDRQGFAAASLSQLVESTGLTRGAFYFHFESKDALAQAIVQAQADRWTVMRARLLAEEADPLRRLLRFAFAAATAVQGDLFVRAANRLMAERALIRRELLHTYPWWVGTVRGFLTDAAAAGELPDLSPLIDSASTRDDPGADAEAGGEADTDRPVAALAEYIVGMWTGVQQAALAGGRNDLPEHVYASWVLIMPWLTVRQERRDELLGLLRELTAEMRAATDVK